MKVRHKIPAFFALGLVLCALLPLAFEARNRAMVRQVYRQLREAGFKTELGEFDFSATELAAARGKAVVKADFSIGRILLSDVRSPVISAAYQLKMTGSNTATVVWRHEMVTNQTANPWTAMRDTLTEHRANLDGACYALLAGPFAFNLNAKDGIYLRFSHWESLPGVSKALATRILVDLHDGKRADAWKNVLAVSRMVTGWQTEAVGISQRMRLELVRGASVALWQAMQAHEWSEEQLAVLEKEWANVNFFERLPETVAFDCASLAAFFQPLRKGPSGAELSLREALKSPKAIPAYVKGRGQDMWYRVRGSYDDEKDVLIYFRDRETEVRRAIQAQNVVEMRSLPGITNVPRFVSKHKSSQVPSSIDTDKYCLDSPRGAVGLLGYAAEAESRRRIILTVIALERHRERTGAYPEKLESLASNASPKALIDFMDGQPLRYRRTSDTQFFLYSIGLDGIDDGGDTIGPPTSNAWIKSIRSGIQHGTDIVWPMAQSR